MVLEITAPKLERKEIFEKNIKPLLIAAEQNNAIDKWMFNLNEDGNYNPNSTVFVSSKHMKIFIINGITEVEKTYLDKRKQLERELGKFNIMVHRLCGSQPRVMVNGIRKPVKWSSALFKWDISNGNYAGTGFTIEGINDVPTLQELCKSLDLDLWVMGGLSRQVFE